MKKSILACLAALVLLPAPAASAQQGRGAPRDAEIVARLKKARAENRRVTVGFKQGMNVTGRVGEIREKGFTLEPDSEHDALVLKGQDTVAGVLYEDVKTVQYPSKMRKFFKGARYGLLGVGGTVIFLPYAIVMAALGREVCC
jgi:hypothetical protein